MALFPNNDHIPSCRGRLGFAYIFLGETIQPITTRKRCPYVANICLSLSFAFFILFMMFGTAIGGLSVMNLIYQLSFIH